MTKPNQDMPLQKYVTREMRALDKIKAVNVSEIRNLQDAKAAIKFCAVLQADEVLRTSPNLILIAANKINAGRGTNPRCLDDAARAEFENGRPINFSALSRM